MEEKKMRHAPAFSEEEHRQHPAGKVGIPENIAALVSFLSDPENGFITGVSFIADGGITKKMICL